MFKQFRDELTKFVGLVVIGLVVAAVLIGGAYWILEQFTDAGRHWLGVGLIFAAVGAFVLGLQVGKSHVRGVERGLDLKLSARERDKQSARPSAATPTPAQRFDDLLPKQIERTVFTKRRDDDTSPIEM